MIRLIEHLPNMNPDPIGLPDAVFVRPTVIAVLDGVKGEVILVAPVWHKSTVSAKAAYAQAAERIMDAVRDLERSVPATRGLGVPGEEAISCSNFSKEQYIEAVKKAKNYIKAGGIFQLYSAKMVQDFKLPPFSLYRSLRQTNPCRSCLFQFWRFSGDRGGPEIIVRVFGNEVTIRPIAGTRPRGDNIEEDNENERDLLSDQKELAEHLMLLDLGRNDVGRVAKVEQCGQQKIHYRAV